MLDDERDEIYKVVPHTDCDLMRNIGEANAFVYLDSHNRLSIMLLPHLKWLGVDKDLVHGDLAPYCG
jgi:hypothetical protein